MRGVTEQSVEGINATLPRRAWRSSPEAAQRCAEGAGLEGHARPEHHDSAVKRRSATTDRSRSDLARISTTLTDVTWHGWLFPEGRHLRATADGLISDTLFGQ